jgi:hypothetical protein
LIQWLTEPRKHFSDITDLVLQRKLDAMTHTCNLSYTGGKDLENHVSRSAQAKSKQEPISTTTTTTTTKTGSGDMHLPAPGWPSKIRRPYFKKKKRKKNKEKLKALVA